MGSLGIPHTAEDELTMPSPADRLGSKRRASSGQDINWERYGLGSDSEEINPTASAGDGDDDEGEGYHRPSKDNELFAEDQSSKSKPWWKANFFLRGPVLFGTWDGVFTTCMINILGVIVFLRSGWMVAEAGIGLTVLVILTAVIIILATVFAAIGICARCQVQRGGVYFLISHVLGARIGGAVGLLYCFGQAVGAAIHSIGFGEAIGQLLKVTDIWPQRGIACAMLFVLVVINLVGVTWVIKVQFALLIIMLLAVLDFAVGSFVHSDPAKGFDGYNATDFWDNSGPRYSSGISWFTVFGVFFPTLTGILGGINMSGDLHNPSRDIPVGTISALGVSTFLYMVFVMILGSTCQREYLRNDFLIANKVAALGIFFQAGIYISSLSACLGSLFGGPRVLQTIASEKVIPFLTFLGRGRGPNKVPVIGITVLSLITLLFILIGDINTLAPIVAMPFLITYAAVEYAYFSLSKTFDMQQRREERLRRSLMSPTFESPHQASSANYGAVRNGHPRKYSDSQGGDLDNLFPERTYHRPPVKRQYSSQASSILSSPDEHSSVRSTDSHVTGHHQEDTPSAELGEANGGAAVADSNFQEASQSNRLIPQAQARSVEIYGKPHIWYHQLSNRWISLLGMFANLVIMFLVHWIYALVNIVVMIIIFFYISRASPGVFPGIAEFRLIPWLASGLKRLCGKSQPEYDHIVVTPMHPSVEFMAAQLTEENEDYSSRERYHHSSLVASSRFQDIDDDDDDDD